MKTIASRIVYRNRWMSVREDQVQRADGSPGIYAVIDKPTAAMIIPLEGSMENGHLYLIEQFRYPVRERYLEFPAGAWEDNPDAEPLDLARGELREETGLIAGRMDHLGFLYFAYGMSSQGFHLYRATELVQGVAMLEHTEQDLLVKRFSVAEFEALCRDNVIKDSATIAAWALLKARQDLL
ncbi:ADP-ribose pyrophosphatase [Acidisarcina polymorpha]|uniref:ADP-ribose pyrophosphatase n=1 Tax=Acidisarcina polymorpha TaxID=2211140 RepID=A0A2Z5G9H9_9BACT|nr:NUDIX hydrolase [Acidisarcina polymorpha]AXC15215.1 ADP-ribose pyrophosphatase [Acidisarcina polymorpha]